jgi:[acyl-carrier-protein] S-malonyltransferase
MDLAGATVFLELGPGTALTGMIKRTIKKATSVAVNTPADVDNLLENLSHASSTGRVADGELLYAIERLVVSPVNGVFTPVEGLRPDAPVLAGQLVGHVGTTEVRSLFDGSLQGLLALDGERVTASQPLAWLRAATVGMP